MSLLDKIATISMSVGYVEHNQDIELFRSQVTWSANFWKKFARRYKKYRETAIQHDIDLPVESSAYIQNHLTVVRYYRLRKYRITNLALTKRKEMARRIT